MDYAIWNTAKRIVRRECLPDKEFGMPYSKNDTAATKREVTEREKVTKKRTRHIFKEAKIYITNSFFRNDSTLYTAASVSLLLRVTEGKRQHLPFFIHRQTFLCRGQGILERCLLIASPWLDRQSRP